jgi:hypothetical protein
MINHFLEPVELRSASLFSRVLNVPTSFFARRLAFRSIVQEWREELSTGKDIQIFIPHTLGMLANYAFFRLQKTYPSLRVNVFYEGVIMFYSYEHSYWKNIKYFSSRYVSGLLFGIPYKIEKQLLSLQDDRIYKIYSPFLEIPAERSKIEKVDLKKVNFTPNEKVCILLGLDLGPGLDQEARKIVEAIFDRIQSEGIDSIYMKDHPSEKSRFFHEVAVERGVKMQLINDKSPIETIIGNFQPGWVISIWSSAMINLTNVAPTSLRLLAFVSKTAVASIGADELINVFEKLGIEVNYIK